MVVRVLGTCVVVGYKEHVWWWGIRTMCGGGDIRNTCGGGVLGACVVVEVIGARVVVGY